MYQANYTKATNFKPLAWLITEVQYVLAPNTGSTNTAAIKAI